MKTFDDLQKDRRIIKDLFFKFTNGEIDDFDFIVDFLSRGKPKVTFLLSVPAFIKKKYDMKLDDIIEKHLRNIRFILSSLGYSNILKKPIDFQVL